MACAHCGRATCGHQRAPDTAPRDEAACSMAMLILAGCLGLALGFLLLIVALPYVAMERLVDWVRERDVTPL